VPAAPLPPRKKERKEDPRVIVQLGGLDNLKNPVTSLEIEPMDFQLVAYCFNQLRYNEPPK
jgi:hypothetical protein